MGVEDPQRAETIEAAQLHATLAAQAGQSPDANPYRHPHPDKALRLIWSLAYVEAGGWHSTARRGLAKVRDAARRIWEGDGS